MFCIKFENTPSRQKRKKQYRSICGYRDCPIEDPRYWMHNWSLYQKYSEIVEQTAIGHQLLLLSGRPWIHTKCRLGRLEMLYNNWTDLTAWRDRSPESRNCTRCTNFPLSLAWNPIGGWTHYVDSRIKHAECEDDHGRYPLMPCNSPYSKTLECYISRNNMNDD